MFDFNKAMEMKKKMDEMQAKLDNISVEGASGDGKYAVTVTVTATKKVKNISISDELMQSGDKEHLEDMLLIAIERAMNKAQGIAEAEARSAALGGDLSGLFGS
ncbi:MAG: YbaB/EbfC family nucleoid-associated protein [Chitinophagales bacterium]